MHARPRHAVRTLDRALIPKGRPGVYAFYRDGSAVYVGKATDLDDRVWCKHLNQKLTMGDSALRRNVAELLGIATPDEIKKRIYVLTAEEVAARQRVDRRHRGRLDQVRVRGRRSRSGGRDEAGVDAAADEALMGA
jgi:hypothetical protein